MKKEGFNIESLIKILDKNKLTELDYQDSKLKITIKKPAEAVENIVTQEKKKVSVEKTPKVKDEIIEILSDSIGRFFYKDNSGNSIVSVGDTIKVGQDIGYISTIGVKNIVKSTVAGEIVEIAIDNGGIADYGKVLLKVKTRSN
ncbi:acetyl-CoA carboxylase biotin carboxyl carrier protein [Cetobacterium sp. SF1]|uniref:acetyl-CoA carboxylase biotin carboxyl carrier protein n=1 Tax=unclassified Cetobacterium TaxID=2630983 RepID=UPI003CEE3B5E